MQGQALGSMFPEGPLLLRTFWDSVLEERAGSQRPAGLGPARTAERTGGTARSLKRRGGAHGAPAARGAPASGALGPGKGTCGEGEMPGPAAAGGMRAGERAGDGAGPDSAPFPLPSRRPRQRGHLAHGARAPAGPLAGRRRERAGRGRGEAAAAAAPGPAQPGPARPARGTWNSAKSSQLAAPLGAAILDRPRRGGAQSGGEPG